jgi:hypothetical protein
VDDLDNDGNKEIIVTCFSGGAIFVFDAAGNVRPGWPVIISPVGAMFRSASIGDIDQDGVKEILFGPDNQKFYCLKPDGTVCPGFPFFTGVGGHRSKPVLVDIDGDGYLEIIFGKENGTLRILRYDGTIFPGYPINYAARGIAVGDVNKDGKFEIFFSRSMLLGVQGFDALTTAMLPNFPLTDPSGQFGFSDAAPNLCDLSDDAGLEIAVGGASMSLAPDGELFAFSLSGQVLPNFPSSRLYQRALTTGCSVNDVDGNGTKDICCGSENYVGPTSTVFCWGSSRGFVHEKVPFSGL